MAKGRFLVGSRPSAFGRSDGESGRLFTKPAMAATRPIPAVRGSGAPSEKLPSSSALGMLSERSYRYETPGGSCSTLSMWEGSVIDEGDPTADVVNGAIETLDPRLRTIIRHG